MLLVGYFCLLKASFPNIQLNYYIMKSITTIILLIPISIVLIFAYPPSYLHQVLYQKPQVRAILDNLEVDVVQAIKQNQFYSSSKVKDCDWLIHNHKQYANSTLPATIADDKQLLSAMCQVDIDNIADIIIVTIIVPKKQGQIMKQINQALKKVQSQAPFTINLLVQELQLSQFPQQIKNKLNMPQYSEKIAHHFLKTRHMAHCRYTHKPCSNYMLYLMDTDQYADQFYQYRGIHVTSTHNLLNSFTVMLGLEPFTHFEDAYGKWRQYFYLMKLNSILKHIRYLQYETPQLPLLKHFEMEVRKWNPKTNLGEWKRLLSSGQLDIFPTEYKLGVYLPILFILFLLPLVGLFK